MLKNPHFLTESESEIRRLIRNNPWATFVCDTDKGLVASHYPVILDETSKNQITLLSHVGKPDDEILELGKKELLVIIQGPHGYISPSWYPPGAFVPTWNHATVHLWGIPELLQENENLKMLDELVNTFESLLPQPRSLNMDPDLARKIAKGTVGFKLQVTRFDARVKFSQNKPPAVITNIIEQLKSEGPYQNIPLAEEMSRYFS